MLSDLIHFSYLHILHTREDLFSVYMILIFSLLNSIGASLITGKLCCIESCRSNLFNSALDVAGHIYTYSPKGYSNQIIDRKSIPTFIRTFRDCLYPLQNFQQKALLLKGTLTWNQGYSATIYVAFRVKVFINYSICTSNCILCIEVMNNSLICYVYM